jgi:hypothetical protein
MRRYVLRGEILRETKNSSYIKIDKDLIEWAINRTARLQEADDRELRADHMIKLQDQFSGLIEELTLAKIVLAKIANGDDTDGLDIYHSTEIENTTTE